MLPGGLRYLASPHLSQLVVDQFGVCRSTGFYPVSVSGLSRRSRGWKPLKHIACPDSLRSLPYGGIFEKAMPLLN